MKILLILVALLCNVFMNFSAQNISINSDGSSPDGSAMLDIKSSDKGILIPRVTDTSSISGPAKGLLIFSNADSTFWYYDGGAWKTFLSETLNILDTTANGTTAVSCSPQSCKSGNYADPNNAQVGDSICYAGNVYKVIAGDYDGPDGDSDPDYIWFDRNLGTNFVPGSLGSSESNYYFQWGRTMDGHQCATKALEGPITDLAPSNPAMIYRPDPNTFWAQTNNDSLWIDQNRTNNPCPAGWRVPTITELQNEASAWSSSNIAGALASSLKIDYTGYINTTTSDLDIEDHGLKAYIASANPYNILSGYYNVLVVSSSSVLNSVFRKKVATCVRCIKDE